MKRRIKRFFRRRYIKFRLWVRRKERAAVEECYDNDHQKRTILFTEKMIRLPSSKLLNVPDQKSDVYLIKNTSDNVYIEFSNKLITITGGPGDNHKYDTLINDKLFHSLKEKFIDKLKANKRKWKDEIYVRHAIIIKAMFDDEISDDEISEEDTEKVPSKDLP